MLNRTNRNKPFGYSWGPIEWPVWEEYKHQCPTAVYVGGTSQYLCRCAQLRQCAGARQVQDLLFKSGEIAS